MLDSQPREAAATIASCTLAGMDGGLGESPGALLDNRKRRPYAVLPSLIIARLPC